MRRAFTLFKQWRSYLATPNIDDAGIAPKYLESKLWDAKEGFDP